MIKPYFWVTVVFETRWRGKKERRKDSMNSETLGTARERWERGSSRSHRAQHIPHVYFHTHIQMSAQPFCHSLRHIHTTLETADRSKVCVPVYVCMSTDPNLSRSRTGVTSQPYQVGINIHFLCQCLMVEIGEYPPDPSWLNDIKHIKRQWPSVWASVHDNWLMWALSQSGKLSLCAQDADPAITEMSLLLVRWTRLSKGG